MFTRFSCLRFLVSCHCPYLNKIVENSVKKWKFWIFGQIFFTYMPNKISYVKLLFRQLLFILPWLSFLQFFVFQNNPYLKKMRNFSEKIENFRILVEFFKAFVLGMLNSKDLFGYFFTVCPRLSCPRFLVSCHHPYLNKFVENLVKKWKFSIFGQIFLLSC